MKASLHAVRIAPKKANLVAKMIRGMTTADAMHVLERTNKKAARILEELLRSAMSNASHNDKQDAQTLVIKSLIVNQGEAYHRGVPMARGRVRPMRKFLSHIDLVLGLPGDEKSPKRPKSPKSPRSSAASEKGASDASQKSDSAVKKTRKSTSSAKTEKADSAASSSVS